MLWKQVSKRVLTERRDSHRQARLHFREAMEQRYVHHRINAPRLGEDEGGHRLRHERSGGNASVNLFTSEISLLSTRASVAVATRALVSDAQRKIVVRRVGIRLSKSAKPAARA